MSKTEREKLMKAASERTTRKRFHFVERVFRASVGKIKRARSGQTVLNPGTK